MVTLMNQRRKKQQAGFSLIELIVVVTIIGILASVAVVQVKNAQRKAQEAALKDNLFEMRKAIDNFYADKQRYPNDLNELVPNYLRKIPKDPITKQDDWETVQDNPANPDEMGSLGILRRYEHGKPQPERAGRDRREEQGAGHHHGQCALQPTLIAPPSAASRWPG
jgi:general secretion pathway protein G